MKGCTTVTRFLGWLILLGILVPGVAMAEERVATAWVSKIVSLQGEVWVKRLGGTKWLPVELKDNFAAGDQIQVGPNSRAGVVLNNDSVLRLDQNTTLMFIEIEQETTFILKLLKGAANFFSRRPRSLKIQTPFVNGVVEGTEFHVHVDDSQTSIDLFEGRLLAENESGSLLLEKGQGVSASVGREPSRRILIQPRGSVQWSMYYPFVVDTVSLGKVPSVERSWALFREGRTSEAISGLEQIDLIDTNASYLIYRAGLFLHVGRVAEADTDIQKALELNPDSGDALALQSVIAVVQNRPDDAIAIAERAVKLAPLSATAAIAYSYALQSGFKLPKALGAAKKAVEISPGSGLAWARLAELQLSVGELKHGEEAAQKAVQLDPGTARAHTTLGYAYLTRIKIDKAHDSFQKAIALDSADPLPRLGMGLAKIRKGDLKEGRREIEIAAGLDPGRSLVRSYLGKAYFDEKRGPLDAKQFDIAKSLDPNDPTPWFYDAIRKQTENRPVEALRDLQKSIELNDNRAVYRSRLMLDQDLASRSASLGRIYNDLDFQNLALIEGYKSLDTDSTNYSAHRLLADNYAAKPRHEIARVSELLQSQLFQPLNLTPIQARLAETDTVFFEGAGPSKLSGNEFNPLFTRNRFALQASGLIGTNDTWGDEITISGLYNKFSASIGQFHYQTDGYRENNDIKQDIFDFFIQGSLTHKTSLQAEYRKSKSDTGDLSRNFDGLYSTDYDEKIDAESFRIGAHHGFSPNFVMVGSFFRSEVENEIEDTQQGLPGVGKQNSDGNLFEIRSDYSGNRFELITGINYMDGTIYEDLRIKLSPDFEIPILDNEEADFSKTNIYAYSNWNVNASISFMLGLSGAWMDVGEQIDQDQVNPKVGIRWRLFEPTTIRFAAFRVLSSTFVSSQTVEPTNVAGFSQLFDDPDGSDVKSYGAAIDHEFYSQLFGGLEFFYRDLSVPEFQIDEEVKAAFFDWDEYTGRAYLYWMPLDTVSIRAEYQYEQFDRSDNSLSTGFTDMETHRVPLSVSYFHPAGISFKVVGTYFYQDGEFVATDTGNAFSDSDHFWVFDTEISYRLPKRFGLLSFSVKNLFDEEFNYKDTDPSNPTVAPEFYALGKITLSF